MDLWQEAVKEEAEGLSLELVPLPPLYGIDFRDKAHVFDTGE